MSMSLLSPQFNSFRFVFPDTFFPKELRDKYKEIFRKEKVLIKDPVEFLNQTVVGVTFLGLGDGTIAQEQPAYGMDGEDTGHVNKFGQHQTIDTNRFSHAAAEQYYRSARNPLAMVDKTFQVTFRHTLGFWNYFFLFESFFYQTLRETKSDAETLTNRFNVCITSPVNGAVLSKVVIIEPLIDQIDSLDLSYQDVHPNSKSFSVKYKFNNIDY